MTASLSAAQRGTAGGSGCPGREVVRDCSWGLTNSVVLEVVSRGERFAVSTTVCAHQVDDVEFEAQGQPRLVEAPKPVG